METVGEKYGTASDAGHRLVGGRVARLYYSVPNDYSIGPEFCTFTDAVAEGRRYAQESGRAEASVDTRIVIEHPGGREDRLLERATVRP